MQNSVGFYVVCMLLSVLISSISQVMLKKAAEKPHRTIAGEYLNPYVISAYGLFFGATLLTIYAYRVIPLSMGPILEATSYFYVTVFGVKLFGEIISAKRIVALCLIVFGIVIYSVLG